MNEVDATEVSVVTRTPTTGTRVTRLSDTQDYATRSKVYAPGELWLSYANGRDEAPLLNGGLRPSSAAAARLRRRSLRFQCVRAVNRTMSAKKKCFKCGTDQSGYNYQKCDKCGYTACLSCVQAGQHCPMCPHSTGKMEAVR